jgi:protoporphyrinogen oxidase
MLEGKFGPHYREVNLAWFWARIYKRTPRLGYYRGGFQAFVDALATAVRSRGVSVETSTAVQRIEALPTGGFQVQVAGRESFEADLVLSTVSPGLMQRLAPGLPAEYLSQLKQLKSMGAVVMTVALDRPLTEKIYWINVPKAEGLPFLALVEHTNMIDPVHYAGDHLLYIGDYLDPSHRYFEMDQEELLAEFLPVLSRFNPDFHPDWVTGAWLHRVKYAQPVPTTGYAQMIPDVRTPLPGLYFASMSQVYPWDRGTNYAVEMGRRVARMMQEDQPQ